MKVVKSASSKHSTATKLFHGALALAIITQLATSQFMEPPAPRNPGNWFFDVHQYAGLAAFAFVFAFWLIVAARKRGTDASALFPWLSAARLAALATDIGRHLTAARSLRLPPYDKQGALSSAVHGLGLLLMTAMAASGTAYYLINTGDPDAGGPVGVVMFVHRTLANLVWAYLIGHACLAIIHHYTSALSLTEMWSKAKTVNSKDF